MDVFFNALIGIESQTVMAEWLRSWTRNPMGFPCAGSNPAHSVSFHLTCKNHKVMIGLSLVIVCLIPQANREVRGLLPTRVQSLHFASLSPPPPPNWVGTCQRPSERMLKTVAHFVQNLFNLKVTADPSGKEKEILF